MPFVVGAALGQSPAGTADPICSLDIAGVTLATSDEDMKKTWGALGLAHVVDAPGSVAGRLAIATTRFSLNPASQDRRDWGPLHLSRSQVSNGEAGMQRNQEDSVRVVQATGQPLGDTWRRWSFAAYVSDRAARLCGEGDPRVSCQYEGSMPRHIGVGPPADGRMPYCVYGLSLQAAQGQLYRSVVGEKEFDMVGRLTESLDLRVAPAMAPAKSRVPPRAPRQQTGERPTL